MEPLRQVLLIEDDEVDALILQRELEEASLSIELVYINSAEEVVRKLEADPESFRSVDIVLLDISLPGMDGLEFLQARQRFGGFAKVPIIMTTSSNDLDNMSRALALGAADYFVKSSRHGQYNLLIEKMVKHMNAAA